MSETLQPVRKAIKKRLPLFIILTLIFGLGGKGFLEQLWKTGSMSAAGAYWVTYGLPRIPEYLALLVFVFAGLIAWEVHDDSMSGGYSERSDGYRPHRDDRPRHHDRGAGVRPVSARIARAVLWGFVLGSAIAWGAAFVWLGAQGLPVRFSLEDVPSHLQLLIAIPSVIVGGIIVSYYQFRRRA
jgi:hypothetical protein